MESGSVGFEDPGDPSSGSWICILLSFMISHAEKSGAFDILVLTNIIQRGMENVTSNGAGISYEISKLSIFTFLRIWCRTSKYGIEFLSPAIND